MTTRPPIAPTVDPDLVRRTPDDDRPPRAVPLSPGHEPTDPSSIPDHDDGPEAFEAARREAETARRRGAPTVRWAADADQPDYAHLLAADRAGVVPSRIFRLTPDVLDLIIRANAFKPVGPDGLMVFALRGALMTKESIAEDRDWIEIEDTRPDHKSFCCTIGLYDRNARKITGYLASTVPVGTNMTAYYERVKTGRPGDGVNCLPTGCYLFRVNSHKKGTIKPALRMTEPGSVDTDAAMTVLRTHDDLSFTHADVWDKTTPYDNVHCAYFDNRFSSSGCLTIKGADGAGPWGRFQDRIRKYLWDTHISVLLVTGRDAAIAAELIASGRAKDDALVLACLGRLRLGSEHAAVGELQRRLGFTGTDYFGAGTRFSLVEAERRQGAIPSDSIYSPDDDKALGWGLLTPALVSGTVSQAPAPTTGGTAPPPGPAIDIRLDPSTLMLAGGAPGAIMSGDRKTLTVPGEGVWQVGPDPGRITFQPEPGFSGKPQPIRYQIADTLGQTATATLSLEVAPPNLPPTLEPDTARTTSGRPVVIAVLANDIDTDGTIDTASVRLKAPALGATLGPDGKSMTVPGEGVWTVLPDGGLSFQPEMAFLGEARALYTATDDKGATAEGNVVVTVNPGAEPPIAADDTASVTAGAPVTVDVLANDKPGRPLTAPVTETTTPPPTDTTGPTPGPSTPEEDELPIPPGLRLTPESLRRLAPKAKPGYVAALCGIGNKLLAEQGINASPRRLCHFLAQILHESGGLTIEHEDMRYSAARICKVWPSRFSSVSAAQPFAHNPEKLANKVYGGRLGNDQPGDGWLYRGRGLVQITGRESYRNMGRALGLELESNPELAIDPEAAVRIAIQTWVQKKNDRTLMNRLADVNDIEAITRLINGGLTNIEDRRNYFRAAWSLLGTGGAPVATDASDALSRGNSGPAVAKLQRLLVKVGMFPKDETIDGTFGPNTERAVARFQALTKLNISGVADKATIEALEKAPEAPFLPDAESARRRGGRRDGEDAGTGGWRDVVTVAAVLLLILAAALFALGTSWSGPLEIPPGQVLIATGALAALAVLLMFGQILPLTGGEGPRGAGATAKGAAPTSFRELDQMLRARGLDERHFADDEPIRGAPGLPEEDLEAAPAAPTPTELVPSSAISAPQQTTTRAPDATLATAKPFPVSAPNAPFVILAMFGGDNNLTAQVRKDLEEMAAGAARYGGIAVLALADTEDGPGMVVEVTPGGRIETVEHLSEIDTGDPETLALFLSRALVTYPRARKAIGFWDHGTGVFDENDPAEVILKRTLGKRARERRPARRLLIPAAHRAEFEKEPGTRAMLHDNSGGVLTNLEAGAMLKAAFARAGMTDKVDLIYSDTCLNGMIEVMEELGAFAHCLVASCETEPALGWDYEDWIRRMADEVPVEPGDWARLAVRAFAKSYTGLTAEYPCTLSAFQGENDITEAFAHLVSVAEKKGLSGFSIMTLARSRCQAFDQRDSYDLVSFALSLEALARGPEPELADAAAAMAAAVRAARLDTVALGPTVGECEGLAFWFPSSRRSLELDVGTYRRLKFNRDTHWAEYLAEMYGLEIS